MAHPVPFQKEKKGLLNLNLRVMSISLHQITGGTEMAQNLCPYSTRYFIISVRLEQIIKKKGFYISNYTSSVQCMDFDNVQSISSPSYET